MVHPPVASSSSSFAADLLGRHEFPKQGAVTECVCIDDGSYEGESSESVNDDGAHSGKAEAQ